MKAEIELSAIGKSAYILMFLTGIRRHRLSTPKVAATTLLPGQWNHPRLAGFWIVGVLSRGIYQLVDDLI